MADDEDEETPPERDVEDFNFKQMRRIRMFEPPTNPPSLPNPRSSLLAVSDRYRWIFVGCPTGIKVIRTGTIEMINAFEEGSMQNIVDICPSAFMEIGHSVRFVGLSSDDLTLSVCYEREHQTVMAFYGVESLGSLIHRGLNPIFANVGETTLTSDAGVSVRNVLWNPGDPGVFAVCLSSGSVVVMELTEMGEINTLATLPGSVNANAICWSPGGDELVVGHRDGRLTQYSQALEVRREIEHPEVFVDDPHSVTDVLWIDETLFAAVYSSFDEGDTPKFKLISAPEGEQKTITNFDDIYYVSDKQEPMYYWKYFPEWSMVVSACSNGYESAVIGKLYGGEITTAWEKWNLKETGRAEMPLTNNNDETFPLGLAFVLGYTWWLPSRPMMMLLSTDGVLCPFYMVNRTPNNFSS